MSKKRKKKKKDYYKMAELIIKATLALAALITAIAQLVKAF